MEQKILVEKQELSDLKSKLNDLNVNPESNNTLTFMSMCDELKIKPWHHKGDSMHGPSVKKFIYQHDIVIKYLNKCQNNRLLNLMIPCLARLKFIAKCLWSKSKTLMSDECIFRLKWNIIEFDHIYHNIIHEYGGGNKYRLGYKWHMLYHSFEWVEFMRWSPAFMDDERVEQYNVHISNFMSMYQSFGGHANLARMMNKVWRQCMMQS